MAQRYLENCSTLSRFYVRRKHKLTVKQKQNGGTGKNTLLWQIEYDYPREIPPIADIWKFITGKQDIKAEKQLTTEISKYFSI